MSTELEGIVKELFVAVDKLDVPGVAALVADDAQMVEEISRKWTRGKANVEAAFAGAAGMVSNITTKVSEFHTVVTGDTGIVTCILDQTYTFEGNEVVIYAPTSVGFIKSQGVWKISLLHSVPLS
jgi:ketosteroid isomerase-like protein